MHHHTYFRTRGIQDCCMTADTEQKLNINNASYNHHVNSCSVVLLHFSQLSLQTQTSVKLHFYATLQPCSTREQAQPGCYAVIINMKKALFPIQIAAFGDIDSWFHLEEHSIGRL